MTSMIYRLEFATSFVRIVADDGETQREMAHCNGSGNRWLQAVKDARLIVASLNYAHGHGTLSDALKCEQCMPTEKLLAELAARPERRHHEPDPD